MCLQVNYPGARALYETYSQDGFTVIAFPCNQFGGQAPGSSDYERDFARRKFGLDQLEVYDKIEVGVAG